MNATTVPAQISAFAGAVRAALSDLPADEVEELTEGLEADLTEAFSEDLRRELPDPAAYADELRIAAGLPRSQPARGRLRDVTDSVRDLGRDLHRSLRSNPAISGLMDFAVSLRPAWWIVRGWAAYQTFGGVFGFEGDLLPDTFGHSMLFLALVGGSVAVGLRSWPSWVRVLIVIGNVWAVIMTVAMLAQMPTHEQIGMGSDYGMDTGYYEEGVGVLSGGIDVTNIFAYDAAGQPLTGVQLFDQDGRPIQTTVGGETCLVKVVPDDDACQTYGAWVPTTLETGASVWNSYPLRAAESDPVDPSTVLPGAVPQDQTPPLVKVPALMETAEKAAAAAKNQENAKKDR